MHNRFQITFFLSLFVGAFLSVIYVFRFYLSPVLFGISFAIVFYPFYKWMLKRVSVRGIASALVVLIVLAVVFLPLSFLGIKVFQDAVEAYARFVSGREPSDVFGVIIGFLNNQFPYVSLEAPDFSSQVERGVGWIVQNVSSFFSSATQFAINLFLGFLAFYYFLKDGSKVKQFFMSLSPLDPKDTQSVFEILRLTVISVLRGTLVVALIQGILAGIGFAIFGVPQPTLWGLITSIAALVPIFGTAVVIIPVAAYLFLAHEVAAGIGLLIWGGVLVGLVDNVLRPQIIERSVKIHPFLILLSVLGGVASFGPMGFLLGPLLLSLLFALIQMYPHVVLEDHTN